MQSVEIFKTNVGSKRLAARILKGLQGHLPALAFNFDLEDCDRILRVEGHGVAGATTQILTTVRGYRVEIFVFAD